MKTMINTIQPRFLWLHVKQFVISMLEVNETFFVLDFQFLACYFSNGKQGQRLRTKYPMFIEIFFVQFLAINNTRKRDILKIY